MTTLASALKKEAVTSRSERGTCRRRQERMRIEFGGMSTKACKGERDPERERRRKMGSEGIQNPRILRIRVRSLDLNSRILDSFEAHLRPPLSFRNHVRLCMLRAHPPNSMRIRSCRRRHVPRSLLLVTASFFSALASVVIAGDSLPLSANSFNL